MPHSEKSWRSRLTTRSQKSYIKVLRNSKRICSLLHIFEKNKYSMWLSHLLYIILFHSFLSSRASMLVLSHLGIWKRIPKPICGYTYLTYRTSHQFVSISLLTRTDAKLTLSTHNLHSLSSDSPGRKLYNGSTTWLIPHLHHQGKGKKIIKI